MGCFHSTAFGGLGPLVLTAGTGHHTTFQRGKCPSPSKMVSSLETKPQPGSPHSQPTWHRGSWEGLRVGPHLAVPTSPASCHMLVVPRHSLGRQDKEVPIGSLPGDVLALTTCWGVGGLEGDCRPSLKEARKGKLSLGRGEARCTLSGSTPSVSSPSESTRVWV